jgi:SNF2-related domain
LLRPHLLRRLKADVLGSLPPKKEQIVRVELAAPQRALYKSLLTNSYQTLISGTCWRTARSVAAATDGADHPPWDPFNDQRIWHCCTA